MNEKELLKLIEWGETQDIEFKESLSLRDEIGEMISAFSNTNLGRILVGVKDTKEVVGVQTGKRTLRELANYIKTHTDNHVFPEISVGEIGGKKIVVIEVKESPEKPVFFKGKAYRRVGDSTHRLSASELRKLVRESGPRVYWDERICEEASLEDIDKEKVRWFLKEAKRQRKLDVEMGAPVKEALDRLELMKNGNLTNAAILLFGKNPQKFFLQAEVRCARFKRTKPVKPFIDMKVFSGNIIDQVDKSLGFVLEHILMGVYLAGKPSREERYEYPPDAVREAIINAICHRDYETSTNIQVRIFDDRIEVWGCGRLPEPLTIEDLRKKHRSILRNPLIAKCLFLIKYVEQWGTGTNDMIDMCLNWEIPEPLFEYVAGDFVVTFRRSRLTEEYLEKMGLNKRQKKAVEYIKEKSKITNEEYREITNVSKPTATRELKELVDKKIFVRYGGTGKGTYYAPA